MIARYDGRCAKCGRPTPKGSEIVYDSGTKKAYHLECADHEPEETPDQLADRLGFKKAAGENSMPLDDTCTGLKGEAIN